MTGKASGHGNHWRPLWGDQYDPERHVLAWVRRALVRPARRDVRDLPDRRRLETFFTAEAGLGICALLIGETVITAYPDVRGGATVALRIREVVPWQNGFEAQVVGDAGGLRLAFFARDAYRNLSRYQPGREQRVVLNALLYHGGISGDPGAPTLRSLADERVGALDFDIDDFAVTGPLADALPVEALRTTFLRCRIALPVLGTALPVYLRPEALDPAPSRSLLDQALGRWPLRGRWLRAQVWLQGSLAEG